MFSHQSTRIVLFGFVAVLAVFLSAVPSSQAVDRIHKGRIIEGVPITIKEAPWVAQIRHRASKRFICGAAIISQWYVVTAAHCLDSYSRKELIVVVAETYLNRVPGEYYVNKDLKKRNIAAIYKHPEYEENASNHADVAVIKVVDILKHSTNTQVISLCSSPMQATDVIDIMGWGHTDPTSTVYSNQLMKASLPLMPIDECRDVYRSAKLEITDTMFCSGIYERKDACQGDSGGPAVRNNELCGIVSWGIGCGSDAFPGVYTSILNVKDFITDCLNDKCVEDIED